MYGRGDVIVLIREKIENAIRKRYPVGTELSCKEIIDCVCEEYEGTNRSSIIPSDYCSNLKNKAPYSGQYHYFEYLAYNTYKVLAKQQ